MNEIASRMVKMPDGTYFVDTKDAVLVDTIEAVSIADTSEPDGERLMVVQLGGRVNRSAVRETDLFLMSMGASARLAGTMIQAAFDADPEYAQRIVMHVDDALQRRGEYES